MGEEVDELELIAQGLKIVLILYLQLLHLTHEGRIEIDTKVHEEEGHGEEGDSNASN